MTFKDKICFVNTSPILGKNIAGEKIMNIIIIEMMVVKKYPETKSEFPN